MAQDYDDIDPNNQRVQIALLAMRLDNLGKEKETIERELEEERAERKLVESDLIKRIGDMEKSFQRGAGILIVLPFIGTAIGILLAYGKVIFAPWTGGKP